MLIMKQTFGTITLSLKALLILLGCSYVLFQHTNRLLYITCENIAVLAITTSACSVYSSQVVLFSDNYYIPHTYTLPYTHIKMRRYSMRFLPYGQFARNKKYFTPQTFVGRSNHILMILYVDTISHQWQ